MTETTAGKQANLKVRELSIYSRSLVSLKKYLLRQRVKSNQHCMRTEVNTRIE